MVTLLCNVITLEINMSKVVHPEKSSAAEFPINLIVSSAETWKIGPEAHVILIGKQGRESAVQFQIVPFYCYCYQAQAV